MVCTCPVAKSGAVLATFTLLLPCFANVCNSIEFPFLQPLNASRAHRVCKIFADYYGLPKIISRYLPSHYVRPRDFCWERAQRGPKKTRGPSRGVLDRPRSLRGVENTSDVSLTEDFGNGF